MNTNNSNEYFENKKKHLKDLLSLTEELVSNSSDFEAFSATLVKRQKFIDDLKSFEALYKTTYNSSITKDEASELNSILSIILDLDKKTVQLIEAQKAEIEKSIKSNTNSQRYFQFNSLPVSETGSRLDYKK